jgi:hypothetical protein
MNGIYLCEEVKYSVPLECEGENIYLISVDMFDSCWKKMSAAYIPKDKGHQDKVTNIYRLLGEDEPIVVPEISVKDSNVGFIDGRHRFAVIRDLGKKLSLVRSVQELDYPWAKKIAP